MALREFDERLIRNDTALKANKVTEAVAASLDAIERELGNLTARLEAGASRIAIKFAAPSSTPIVLDGEVLETSAARPVVDPMTIAVGDIAKITISPPAGSFTAALSQRQELTNKLKQLLDTCGATNAAEARRTRASRQSLEAEARGLQAERAALGLEKLVPAAEIARLRADLEGMAADLAQTLADLNLQALPIREDVEQRRNQLAQSRKTDRNRRAELDIVIEAQNRNLGSIANERGRLRGTLSEVQSQLDTDLAALPDGERQMLLSEAEEAWQKKQVDHRSKAALLEEKRRDTPAPDEIQRRETRVKRLESALENQKSGLSKLDLRIANLEGQIQTAGGDGLGEKVTELREQHDMAARELARQSSRVPAWRRHQEYLASSDPRRTARI